MYDTAKEDIIEYNKIKGLKVIEVIDFLDLADVRYRLNKIKERIDAENKWVDQFSQKPNF